MKVKCSLSRSPSSDTGMGWDDEVEVSSVREAEEWYTHYLVMNGFAFTAEGEEGDFRDPRCPDVPLYVYYAVMDPDPPDPGEEGDFMDEYKIRIACHGDPESICGLEPEDHDWTREGEGGEVEEPGVWAIPGGGIAISDHCQRCGISRRWSIHDGEETIEYELPEKE